MTKKLDPINLPNEWHRFLYGSVLLEWETSVCRRQIFPRFNARKTLCDIELVKVDVLTDMVQSIRLKRRSAKTNEHLIFYPTGPALKGLINLIRNCVAHGHYTCPRRGWIEFCHMYQGKTKLAGEVKFVNLKSLIHYIVDASA